MSLTNFFVDTETCGFHGLAVLLQWGTYEGPGHYGEAIETHSTFEIPVGDTIDLIDYLMTGRVVAFNYVFDHFHLCKLRTLLSLFNRSDTPLTLLKKDPRGFFEAEKAARDVDLCLKPAAVQDLLLIAQMGKYQGLMERKQVRIRKVPTVLAGALLEELNRRIDFPDIFFARSKYPDIRWKLEEVEDRPDLKDVVLTFKPSRKLKHLVQHAFPELVGTVSLLTEVDPISKFGKGVAPFELGFAPFTLAADKELARIQGTGKYLQRVTQRNLLPLYINHWNNDPEALLYAANDVEYLRRMWDHLDRPEEYHINSELTAQIAACRWRGYAIDLEAISNVRASLSEVAKSAPKAPKRSLNWLRAVAAPEEAALLKSTSSAVLDKLATWPCLVCEDTPEEDCPACKNTRRSPVALRARKVSLARQAASRMGLLNKLVLAERLHASFKPVGSKSDRMSGDDDLNPQGFPREGDFRTCLTLALPGMALWGGDFDSFEVSILDAHYDDPALREVLLSGKKIHAIFGMELYPGHTYEEVCASKGGNPDMYGDGKAGVFSQAYFGDAGTLERKLGIPKDRAIQAEQGFLARFPKMRSGRQQFVEDYTCLRQPREFGPIYWHEPKMFVEAATGFRRYFDLEYSVCKSLFDLAQKPPPDWKQRFSNVKISRRPERVQTASGAVASALYGAVFGISGQCFRAAGNHVIQCWGAGVTKRLQLKIWSLQPTGLNPWLVQPMNVHDEVLCPCKPEVAEELKQLVEAEVESNRPKIPTIGMKWQFLNSWAEK